MPYNTPDLQVIAFGGAKLMTTQLTTAVAATGNLNGAKLDLFENNFTPTPFNVIADFTIPAADWAGYAQKTITGWGAQRKTIDGRVAIESQNLMEFVGPGAGGGPTIYGYIVRDSTGNLLYSVKFATPVAMSDGNAVLDLVATFTFPNVQ